MPDTVKCPFQVFVNLLDHTQGIQAPRLVSIFSQCRHRVKTNQISAFS